ncbi:MAG: hypothetical protein HOV79_33965 [Hamadaea sp.]|nr:hypothetical protein [Hamadaea sp.]
MSQDVTLGPVGQTVVFENEHVRVWEIVLAPRESQAWHCHENPYLVLALVDAENRIDPFGGGDPRFVKEEAGGVVFRPAGEVHMLTNQGSTTYKSRLVELLTTPR